MKNKTQIPSEYPVFQFLKEGQEFRQQAETRKVYDNIHGFIYFPQYVWDFIDTPHFQRLRKIKQLSCLEYVFPGATHSRFEHSLGTAHLALTFLNALIENNRTSYKSSEIESARKTITIAGLLHDLGHGPYSHTFDGSIVKKIRKNGGKEQIKWQHQIASQQLFKDLIKKHGLSKHFQSYQEIQRVIDLIHGKKDGKRNWEFQIISNKKNGIDVDKLDYFRRDAFHLGAKNIYIDHELLFKQAKIIDNEEICYPTKYVQTVYNIFHSRYKLYKNYYLNLVAKGIELMICDILKCVEGKFKFRQICQQIYTDPKQYIKLNDNIIEKIEYIFDNMRQDQQDYEKFKTAIELLDRVKKRKIYKFVREFHYYIKQSTDKEVVNFLKEKITQKNIKDYFAQRKIDTDLISVSFNDIGFGLTQQNPLKNVGFFIKQLNKPKKLQSKSLQSLTMLYTNAYLQKSIKIFVKNFDSKLFNDVKAVFEYYFRDLNIECKTHGVSPLEEGPIGTPFKPKTQQNQMEGKKVIIPTLCLDMN